MDLFGAEKDGSDNPFQEVTLQNAILDEEDERKKVLDGIIKDINRSNPKASVTQESEKTYSVSIHFGKVDLKGCQVTVRPLLSKKTEAFENDIRFDGLALTQLSEFYSLSVSNDEFSTERVLIIPTTGLPEDREKAIVSSVVSDRDCFYRYIAFLLGDDSILGVLEGNVVEGESGVTQNRPVYRVPALYEKMLQTAANAPEKFKGIEYLMKTISEDGIIPDQFKALYETFKKAVKITLTLIPVCFRDLQICGECSVIQQFFRSFRCIYPADNLGRGKIARSIAACDVNAVLAISCGNLAIFRNQAVSAMVECFQKCRTIFQRLLFGELSNDFHSCVIFVAARAQDVVNVSLRNEHRKSGGRLFHALRFYDRFNLLGFCREK